MTAPLPICADAISPTASSRNSPPLLWLFASLAGDAWAAAIGIVWPIGRVIYARGYYAAAEKRGPGFGITFLSTVGLLLGSLFLLVRGMLA